jgi:hypothetical protein
MNDQTDDFDQTQPVDQTPEPQRPSNPIDDAVEAITYGGEDANQKLRTAIDATISQREEWRALAEEE